MRVHSSAQLPSISRPRPRVTRQPAGATGADSARAGWLARTSAARAASQLRALTSTTHQDDKPNAMSARSASHAPGRPSQLATPEPSPEVLKAGSSARRDSSDSARASHSVPHSSSRSMLRQGGTSRRGSGAAGGAPGTRLNPIRPLIGGPRMPTPPRGVGSTRPGSSAQAVLQQDRAVLEGLDHAALLEVLPDPRDHLARGTDHLG